MSKIEWTDQTWNPVVGCSIVSPGCTNCYAMRMAARLDAMGTQPHYAGTTRKVNGNVVWTGRVAMAPDSVLLAPLRRKKPTTYFVNSMGDLFHESVPDEWIDRVFAVMALCPQHTFQILTKRSARMRDYIRDCGATLGRQHELRHWIEAMVPESIERTHARLAVSGANANWRPLSNVWLGVSTEDQRRADERVPDLLETPAAVRFISAEPLLGPIDLTNVDDGLRDGIHLTFDALDGTASDGHDVITGIFGNPDPKLDWVIVGGESGPGARPMHPDWARSLRDQCAEAGVPFFFKQVGDWAFPNERDSEFGSIRIRVGKKRAGRILDGREHNEFPRIAK